MGNLWINTISVETFSVSIFINFISTFDKFYFLQFSFLTDSFLLISLNLKNWNKLYNDIIKTEIKSKIQSFISFKEITYIILVYLTMRWKKFTLIPIYVCCLSSQAQLPGANASWQICFDLHYEIKQSFSCSLERVCCTSSKITVHTNMRCQLYSFPRSETNKKITHVLLCELIFYNLSHTSTSKDLWNMPM